MTIEKVLEAIRRVPKVPETGQLDPSIARDMMVGLYVGHVMKQKIFLDGGAVALIYIMSKEIERLERMLSAQNN